MAESIAAPVVEKKAEIQPPKRAPFKIALGNNRFLLPGGLLSHGTLLKECTLRPTDGTDEEAVLTSETMDSGWHMTDALLSRVIVDLGGVKDSATIEKLVPSLLMGDRMALNFMLEKISIGDKKAVRVTCSRGHETETFVDIDSLEYVAYPSGGPPPTLTVDIPMGLVIEGKRYNSVQARLLTGLDERALQPLASSPGLQKSKMLELSCLKFVGMDIPMDPRWIRSMAAKDRSAIIRRLDEYSPGPVPIAKVPCSTCRSLVSILVRPDSFFGG